MAELNELPRCPRGHSLRADGQPGDLCDERCDDAPPPSPPASAAVTVVIADTRLCLAAGETIVLGREGDVRVTEVLRRYENVSRRHLQLTAGHGNIDVQPLTTRNGTFLGDGLLTPGETRNVQLPVTIRLAANCYVHLDVTRD